MTDRDIELRLRKAAEQNAPNDIEDVFSRMDRQKGEVIMMTTARNKVSVFPKILAACAAFALAFGGAAFYRSSVSVASVVSLDVNPSIELSVNRKERVLECRGLNDEAKEILREMDNGADLEGTKLDVAVNAIVGALVRNGYLDSISSAILISVEDKDTERAARLQQELTAEVDTVLQEKALEAAVLSQTVKADTVKNKLAEQYGISTGKAALIDRVLEENPDLDYGKLAELTVAELKDLIEIGAPDMPIGREGAKNAVIDYADVKSDSGAFFEVEAELDNNPAHYDVTLHHNGEEFDYIVDAFTGEVLSGDPYAITKLYHKPNEKPDWISHDKALDEVLKKFYERFPELEGYNIFDHRIEDDLDDEIPHYDVTFRIGGFEVEYEVDAKTGKILTWDTDYNGIFDRDDGWNDNDRDDRDDDDDYDGYDDKANPSDGIGKTKARDIALDHAGISKNNAKNIKVEADYDDGRLKFEVEFKADGYEFDYTIDGKTGSVLEHEKDRDD